MMSINHNLIELQKVEQDIDDFIEVFLSATDNDSNLMFLMKNLKTKN